MAVKKKKQAPSKVKYDAAHPVISFRLSLELKEKLEDYIEEKGISSADFIKMALNVQAAEDEELKKEAYDAGYEAGYESGLEKGKERVGELKKVMVEFQDLFNEHKAYVAKIESANQAYAARNRELEAQLVTVQKIFNVLDDNEFRYIVDKVHKAQLIKARDNLRAELARYV